MSRKRSSQGKFGDQSGIGMVLVMGIGLLVLGMGFLAQRIFDGAITSSSGHVTSEQALHLAENGIDQTLARISKNPAFSNTTVLPDGSAEKAWAIEQAGAMAAQRGAEGEFAAVKPAGRNVIYGVSWIPDRATARRTRVVKAEYLLSAFNPSDAILVGGPLRLHGNPGVGGIAGNVHANDDIDVVGNPIIAGDLSTSGAFLSKHPSALPNPPATSESGAAEVDIPTIDPREEWDNHNRYGHFAVGGPVYEAWHDLCPDGTVRKPDGGVPCAGTLAPGFAQGVDFRGFSFSGDTWSVQGSGVYDGIYFAYRTNIKVTGNPGSGGAPWKVTLFAEPGPDDAAQCPNLVAGDIDIGGTPRMSPFLDGLTLMAGRDLKIKGNTNAAFFSGLMMAKEQFSVLGNGSLTGSLVAEGLCNTPGSLVDSPQSDFGGNASINYDGGLEAKIGSIPRTTLWLEL
jgi:hypothetical protein